ncbi:hypothetical protein TRIATDRAFT_285163 [Trichoderma atroviride IMI 206040]|uniref:Uncharacterized protein n=1 Tax=Hypocrea atroviridis (strain ATCC 20476 / IMI 206040) TaxID=452589 RepID=G9NYZ4_HYPAI|nr:uncharacterized protein TRIATDRAFT_285163 [Trichoderma atroviride IMI 206040]EHK44546.1 hypothetical protein TRIATDRAFT_285163 [Trichoderma atroviride IMI 206040]
MDMHARLPNRKWPTCTPCFRVDAVCSGPSTEVKFVHNGVHATTNGTDVEVPVKSTKPQLRCSTPFHAIVAINSRDVPGGSSYSVLRLSQEPRRSLTTVADRLAATLVRHLEHGSDSAFLLTLGHIKFVPARVGASPALRDCVAMLCSSWANFRRALPVEQIINSQTYGKALRSLQIALNDERQQLSAETLAAVTIMERVEIAFDARRSPHRAVHGQGMHGLMLKRGPPRLSDELDTCLAFDNMGSMLAHSLVEGGPNLLSTSQWKNTLEEALRNGLDLPSDRLDAYALDLHSRYWPLLVHELKLVRNSASTVSMKKSAAALQARVLNTIPDLKALGESIVAKMRRLGNMTGMPDDESPLGMSYHFTNMGSAQCWMTYKMLSVVLNRILHALALLLSQPVALLDSENVTLSREISQPPLFLAYEGANGLERAYLLKFILWSDKFKKRFPQDSGALEKFVLTTAYALSGRGEFCQST